MSKRAGKGKAKRVKRGKKYHMSKTRNGKDKRPIEVLESSARKLRKVILARGGEVI